MFSYYLLEELLLFITQAHHCLFCSRSIIIFNSGVGLPFEGYAYLRDKAGLCRGKDLLQELFTLGMKRGIVKVVSGSFAYGEATGLKEVGYAEVAVDAVYIGQVVIFMGEGPEEEGDGARLFSASCP